MSDDRNPLFIPEREQAQAACIYCGNKEFVGRIIAGVANMTCKKCGKVTMGGLPQVPQDPRIPLPPLPPNDVPTIRFEKNPRGEPIELRRRPNLTQDFRKGALEPKPGDE